jgi:hypothetical protein
MKRSCVPSGRGKCVRLGEESLANLEIVQPHSLRVRREMLELAPPVVRMAVESAHERSESLVACERPQDGMVVDHLPESAAYVVGRRDLPEDVKEVFDNGISILRAEEA